MIKANVGSVDKYIRVIGGIVLFILALVMQKSLISSILLVVGAVLVLTATINFCPLYAALGLKTNAVSEGQSTNSESSKSE